MLIGKGGCHGNVFRITPPLCFTKQDAGKLIQILATSSLFTPQIWGTYSLSLGADFLVDAMDYTMSKI